MNDLWQYLARTSKPIVLYGMGDGADKILAVLARFGIEAADFFASDGFVRGQFFHGKRVLSYSEILQKYDDFIVLLSFASSRPEVIRQILAIDRERELYAPDVPVFGGGLFDSRFYAEHKSQLQSVSSRLADERSKEVLEQVIEYKLTGRLAPLFLSECDEEETYRILRPLQYRVIYDLGAYTGDTAKTMLARCPNLDALYALEPDRRNFKKLCAFAEEHKKVRPIQAAAWDESTTLVFDHQGNRNANVTQPDNTGGGQSCHAVSVDELAKSMQVDFIKYDVEGSEKEALAGSQKTIERDRPDLLVSLYHRVEDLFALPLQIAEMKQDYRFYIRRLPYIPAWDLNLYCVSEK
ncbi:MAG: FkbM family methyltransferase [Clostridiales bacterium]|nr:FkbM family methyltransferase [Clostridiales bacterium]